MFWNLATFQFDKGGESLSKKKGPSSIVVQGISSRYGSLGVDVEKKGIDRLKILTNDLYPQSFCTVTRHPTREGVGAILHADGAGTKPIVAYLSYKETGNPGSFSGLAQDVVAMNVDDIVCVGGTPLTLSDYVALNPFALEREALLGGLADGFKAALTSLADQGHPILFGGGETADLPDIVRTFDVSATVYGEVGLDLVITGDSITPGDVIVGLRSGGRAKGEGRENSGIMCNGITLARHSLLSPKYLKKYPEVGSGRPGGYFGSFELSSEPDGLGMTVGEALLSPTRIYLPVAKRLVAKGGVKALVHNTGSGMTKCKRLGKGIRYVKDRLPEPDPIFKLIREGSREGWGEMYRAFNMGIGLEAVADEERAHEIMSISESFGIGACVIGRCEGSPSGHNTVLIKSPLGTFEY
jgi:phosphoribosylformylglycinamidine cyclo-ligase